MNPTFAPNHAICPNHCGCLVSCLVDGYHCANCGTHRTPIARPYSYARCPVCKRPNVHVTVSGHIEAHYHFDTPPTNGRHDRCIGTGRFIVEHARSTKPTPAT